MSVERIAIPARPAPRTGSLSIPSERARQRQSAAQPVVDGRRLLSQLARQSVLMQLIFAMGLISVAALIYVNQASKVSVLQFSIADQQRAQGVLRMQNSNLYATATSLQSLPRIEAAATSQLHMIKPAYGNILWIRPLVPIVAPPPVDTYSASARVDSQPLSWMQHAVEFIGAQL